MNKIPTVNTKEIIASGDDAIEQLRSMLCRWAECGYIRCGDCVFADKESFTEALEDERILITVKEL